MVDSTPEILTRLVGGLGLDAVFFFFFFFAKAALVILMYSQG